MKEITGKIHKFKGEEPMRLNKYMAQIGACSRRKAEELITQGAIKIDGEIVKDLGRKLEKGQSIEIIDLAQEKLNAQFSIIYNKPVGIVSGHAHVDEIPAIRLIQADNQVGNGKIPPKMASIPPVGRLDKDSRGLLILSQDGVLVRNIIAPSSIIEKEYIVEVKGQITEQKIQKLCFGLSLDGRQLKRAKVTQIEPQILKFILIEGRNRQIRRMCEKLGLGVIDLLRIRIGNLTLDGLNEGEWRHLTRQEIDNFAPLK